MTTCILTIMKLSSQPSMVLVFVIMQLYHLEVWGYLLLAETQEVATKFR